MGILNPLNLIPLPYRILIGLILTIGLAGGSFYFGYNYGYKKAQLAISEFQVKKQDIAANIQKSGQGINDKHTIQFVDRIKVIHDKEYVYLTTAATKVPAQNQLSNGWVYLHDKSALGLTADPLLSSDPKASGVMDNKALETITKNYSSCDEDREQLKNLQQSIIEYNSLVKEANKKGK